MSLLEVSTDVFGLGSQIKATPLELQIPENLSKADWLAAGRRLPELIRAVRWWAGDWVVYGKRTYGDEVMELQEVRETVKQMEFDTITTASCVKPEHRREGLEWNAHREVAELAEEKQEEWLKKMEAKGWDVVQLRREIRHAGATSPVKGNAFVWNGPTKGIREAVAWFKSTPESYWTPLTKELWKKELRPLVELYQDLDSRVKRE